MNNTLNVYLTAVMREQMCNGNKEARQVHIYITHRRMKSDINNKVLDGDSQTDCCVENNDILVQF